MYIEDRLFSESTEQVLFSVLLNEDEYQLFSDFQEYLFSENHKKRNGKNHKRNGKLNVHDSHVGLGRAVLAAPFDGGGGLVGGYFGKKAADEADEEGYDDDQILARARDKGLKAGAITGAASGALTALGTGCPISIPVGAALGALGGRNAASVNTKARLRKRRGGLDSDGFI